MHFQLPYSTSTVQYIIIHCTSTWYCIYSLPATCDPDYNYLVRSHGSAGSRMTNIGNSHYYLNTNIGFHYSTSTLQYNHSTCTVVQTLCYLRKQSVCDSGACRLFRGTCNLKGVRSTSTRAFSITVQYWVYEPTF